MNDMCHEIIIPGLKPLLTIQISNGWESNPQLINDACGIEFIEYYNQSPSLQVYNDTSSLGPSLTPQQKSKRDYIYSQRAALLHAQSNSKGGKNNIKYLYKIYVCYVGLYNRHSLYQWTSSCVNGHDTLRRKK